MLLDRALVRQQAIERTIEAIVVHQRRRERQQVLQRGAAIPRLGDVQFARRLAQPGEHEHARHRRPRHRFTPFRQELCQQVVEAQRAPERPPEPYVAEGTPAFQPDALELDRNCLIGRRRGEEVGLLSVPRNRACQRLRAGAPGRVQFTEMRDGLLNDIAADAHRADKAPVAVDLAVLPPRRVTEVHHPAYPSQWRTKSTKLVGTTSTFPVFGSDGGWKYERRGRHDRAVQLLNCGSWASPFAFFWCSRVLSTLALHMQTVAVGWQLYTLTGSALDLGLLGLVQFVPTIALTLVGGHVADRRDRRVVVVVCQVAQAGASVALAVGSHGGWLGRGSVLAIVGVLGAAQAFANPSRTALLPRLVPLGQIPRAIASVTSATQTSRIVGPALGGLLYDFGPAIVYVTVAALVSSVVLARRPVQHGAGPIFFGAVLVFGVATIVFGVSTNLLVSLAALTVLGAADLLSVVIRHSLVQMRTPDGMRGRVSAVHSVSTNTSNQLGEFESGVLAALLGPVPAVVLGRVGTSVVAPLWMYRFPELRRFHLADS